LKHLTSHQLVANGASHASGCWQKLPW
jgi:hypothetical protein